DAGVERFLDTVLNQRLVDDRQHFLRHRLRRGQKARAVARGGKQAFVDRSFFHISSMLGALSARKRLRDARCRLRPDSCRTAPRSAPAAPPCSSAIDAGFPAECTWTDSGTIRTSCRRRSRWPHPAPPPSVRCACGAIAATAPPPG